MGQGAVLESLFAVISQWISKAKGVYCTSGVRYVMIKDENGRVDESASRGCKTKSEYVSLERIPIFELGTFI